ncbi:MAG: PKD domain-containing protein [Saprospiraceae bacterium]|nr:PKD domain-containing protein [Saprospiraceae bacterium]
MSIPVRSVGLLVSILLFPLGVLFSQRFDGQLQGGYTAPELDAVMTQYEVYRIDADAIDQYFRQRPNGGLLTLQLHNRRWEMALVPSRILPDHYTVRMGNAGGAYTVSTPRPTTWQGTENQSQAQVRLTFADDFMHGYVKDAQERWCIQPLRDLVKGADMDLFVVYPESAVLDDHGGTCAVVEEGKIYEQYLHAAEEKVQEKGAGLACYELELAIASDNLMITKYGSPSGVEAHNVAVINDVEGDYTGSFNHDIEFNIVTQFFPSGADPWTSSTNAGTLLGSFRNWGQSGGFGVSFDLGELWTNRDLDGGTIGIAYLNGVCNSLKYHVLQDFSSNSNLLRCLTSHEIGHNFSMQHDNCPPTFIMCPFVSTSSTWSNASINSFNNFVQPLINNGCLSPCNSGPPLASNFDWSPNPSCEDTPIQFDDQSLGSPTGWQWTFQGGSPGTSTQQNPVVQWANPGTYNVTLTVTKPGASSSTLTKQIVIEPKPVANFTASVSNLTVTFNNTSTPATGVSYFWEFGDGNVSVEEDPVHTYDFGGIYTVTLTVTGICGSSVKTLLVNTAPTAQFVALPTDGCAPLDVQFVNQSSQNATSFLWQFPGGSPSSSNQENPNVTYNLPGTYTVTLTVFNSQGSNAITRTNYITVGTIPNTNFTSSANGNTVTFTNLTAGAGNTYLWEFGDGDTSTLTSPVHTYAVGGTYTVTLTATNACGPDTFTQVISLIPPPSASFSAGDTIGCAPLTVELINLTVGNVDSIRWQLPGGTPSTGTSDTIQVTYNTPGDYDVTLIAYGPGGVDTTTLNDLVTVNGTPDAGFTSSINGATVSFTNTSTDATSYNWTFGDGQSSTQTNPTHTYTSDGTYTVRLIATNTCGNDTFTQQVVIVTLPNAGFSANVTSGCAPLTVQFNNLSSPNATSFNWSFPGGTPATSTQTNPAVVYNTPGTYSVTLIATNAAGSDTTTLTNYITVNTVPAAGFTSSINGATVNFTNTSTGATSYNWTFGDGQSSTQANPTHTYTNDGTYTVTLVATNTCGTNTFTQQVVIVTLPNAGFSANVTSGCAPLTVQFNNLSSPNATSFNWSFPGGTPASSTQTNPTVVYNTPGTYSVTLIATNAAGSDTTTLTNYITVNTVPAAGFTSITNGATVSFTNTSTGATSYNWTFGDGQSSTQANPTHTYTNDGTYTVTLTATNSCGTNTFTQQVAILTAPNAAFSANVTSGCVALTVQFNNLSSPNATSFNWSFPGGTPASSTQTNPTVVYNTPGTYSVTLIATNGVGSDTTTLLNYINAGTVPGAGFSTSVSGANVTLSNTSSGASSYLWLFGDGNTSNNANPTHSYASDGVYTITLIAANACGNDTTSQVVTITTPPTAGFTMNGNSGCAPLTIQFNNTSSANATSYAWTFENGTPSSSTEQNPSATWNTPGVYLVRLTVTNAAGSSQMTDTVVVNGLPTAGFSFQYAGVSVVFANTSSNATQYSWDFGDGNTSSETDPTHTYGAPGPYTVVLTATNACGQQQFTQQIEISGAAPLAAFNASSANGCIPFNVQFTDQSAGNPDSWSWTFEGGNPATSKEQNPSVSYTKAGVYDVTLIVTNQFGADTMMFNNMITVQTFPTVQFSYSTSQATVTFTNGSQNAGSYLWNFGDGKTSTEANPTHTYALPGTYTVSLTATNECGASTLEQMVQVIFVGTNEATWLTGFKLFPNPTTGDFTVEFSTQDADEVEFILLNKLGQLIVRDVVGLNNGYLRHRFSYPELTAGPYLLQVRSGAHVHQEIVVFQR